MEIIETIDSVTGDVTQHVMITHEDGSFTTTIKEAYDQKVAFDATLIYDTSLNNFIETPVGDENGNASRPQIFSATFLKIMPRAMVDIIQPNSDLILIAGRTPMSSTKLPCNIPNKQTTGIITQ